MSNRRTVLVAGSAGALVGIVLLALVFAFADWWYASPAGLPVLVLTPGIVVGGMLNPISSGLYFAIAAVVQAVSYAFVAVIMAAIWGAHRGRRNAV